ncbi:hypothetical protein E1301_Tti001001 [Triplophysa tibetana]|uniref:Uncharacterized protein n=1 Tax=Triplophysa tibetana TaxID=1572043 RepID=A0A5A9N3T7_9TELE|nr:hypothetical protein E1301_Tti001001 [Triplophysa tibetana]
MRSGERVRVRTPGGGTGGGVSSALEGRAARQTSLQIQGCRVVVCLLEETESRPYRPHTLQQQVHSNPAQRLQVVIVRKLGAAQIDQRLTSPHYENDKEWYCNVIRRSVCTALHKFNRRCQRNVTAIETKSDIVKNERAARATRFGSGQLDNQ